DELGVQRQDQDADALAARHGLTIGRRFVDNDLSATYGGPRPDYAELIAAVERGEVDCVIVYALGRLWRNRAERAAGIELFRKHGVSVLCVKGPQLDMTAAAGRMLAGLLGEFDTFETEQMSEREKRKMLQNVQHGKPPSGRRCYGYSPDGWEIAPDEAQDVRHVRGPARRQQPDRDRHGAEQARPDEPRRPAVDSQRGQEFAAQRAVCGAARVPAAQAQRRPARRDVPRQVARDRQ